MEGTNILLSERIKALESALRKLVDFGEVCRHGDECYAHDDEDCTTDCPGDEWTIEHGLENCTCTYGDVLHARQLLGE